MRLSHFESLQPVCPNCLSERREESLLTLATIVERRGDTIHEGTLHCSASHCNLEFPIIDGIPLLLPDPRRFIADNIEQLNGRGDLSALSESIIGDCLGPQTNFDITRQHLSCYTWDAYGEFDPNEARDGPVQPGGVARCLQACLERITTVPAGPVLDIGCAVGRSSFELTATTEDLVLGIDTNLSMLRQARRVLDTGRVSYPRRRIGVVYDRREFAVDVPGMERVDFWACSGMSPPFRGNSFAAVTALQVLDAVPAPLALLAEIAAVLKPGGSAALATPYDWSSGVTAFESWIGGHSQRAVTAGAAEPLLRALLTPGAHPMSIPGLVLRDELEHFPWHTRIHDRSVMLYDAHIVVAEAVAS